MESSSTQKRPALGCRTLFFLNRPCMKHPALLLTLLLLLNACQHPDTPVKLQGETQGTYYSIIYYDSLQRNLQPQIDSVLNLIDCTVSLWNDNSLIRRINNGQDSLITPLFHDLLSKSRSIRQYTHGAFDCRIGALVSLYGFGFKKRADIQPRQIDSLMAFLQPEAYLIADSTIQSGTQYYTLRRLTPIEFDFNAIAQGYTVDMLSNLFDSLGIHNHLIDVGGEVIAKGSKHDGTPWTVGIERPAQNKYSSQEIETAIALHNQSVVTSGNYRKYYEKNGTRYSHTIDPATGHPVNHTLLSVSVVSNQSWYADAMATSFMVMGLDKSLQFINAHPDNPDIQAAFFIYHENGQYRTYATPSFQKMIIE